jgi:glucose/arabinose dehydrogenase
MRAVAVALVLVLAACSGGDDDSASPLPSSAATTTTTAASGSTSLAPVPSRSGGQVVRLADVEVTLTSIARVASPTAMAVRRGDDRLYVTEQRGRVVRVPAGGGDPQTVLDLRDQIRSGGEQGLLGIAFSPDGSTMYLNFTDTRGDTHIDAVDMGTNRRRNLLVVDQPYSNHNGGQLAVRADGMLWIGLGDGGSGGDPHGNGQSLRTLLGKILRIDPSRGSPYAIPADNPFVGRSDARGEIWAYGLRNPWRFSFDRETGDLWIGDVGQNAWEEVDLEPAGGGGGVNYGWNRREGAHPYKGGRAPTGAVDPLFEYSHADGGVSVTGGYVYRGSRVPGLRGAYLYADYADGKVRAVRQQDGKVIEQADLGVKAPPLSSFGEDATGELYVLSLSGRVYRLDPR